MHIHIHNYHHVTADGDILNRLNLITQKLDEIMTKQERLDLAVANLFEGTNEIAKDLQELKDQIAAGTVSDESVTKLEENIAILGQLGQAQ